ncbi:hypothetical protein AMJ87_08340 [candidate division WOR_3 bacterium SM23_60]|uniref:Uncharacterized protein n=1 Tax=candidate division WOR_3 bacterium SM23_60 TaxID=1703780 RepID=A0A0S8GD10_UNCW3|nr:MAG: hypothetical protein AMJ87_08340 [candidate division WOR_3 bacterium SM23_60]
MVRTFCCLCGALLLVVCARERIDRRLVAYLQQERTVRQKVQDEQTLSDSLKALQKRFNVDRAQQLARVSDNPEDWLYLLEALEHTQ